MATRIDAAVNDLLRYLRIGHGVFHITGCWANVNAPGAAHEIHQHPNHFLSCVYYVRTPEDADTINFHDPRSQTSILRPPLVALTADNFDEVAVRVVGRHAAAVPLLASAFCGRQPERRGTGKRELQRHALAVR